MKKTLSLYIAVLLVTGGNIVAGDWGPSPKELVPLASPVAEGNCLTYDFLDLEYGITEFGSSYYTDGDFHGVGFSKSLGSSLFFTGGYADGGYTLNGLAKDSSVTTQRYRLGLGARHSIARCVDLTFEGGMEHTDAEYGGCDCLNYDSWSYYVGPGIRARSGRLEMFAKALYTGREGDMSQTYLGFLTTESLSADEDGWLFSPGLVYHVTENLGIKVAAEIGELDTAVTFGIRLEF